MAFSPRDLVARADRLFPRDAPLGRFALNALAVSAAVFGVLLALYVVLTPGMSGSLSGDGRALGYFLRQAIFNGLLTVFVINWVGFSIFAARPRAAGPRRMLAALARDFALRAALLAGVTAVSYLAFAEMFGSFGGDPAAALSVVGPTLAGAATFGNLAGPQLYACALGATPLVVATAVATRGDAIPAALSAVIIHAMLFAGIVSGLAALF